MIMMVFIINFASCSWPNQVWLASKTFVYGEFDYVAWM